MPVETIVIRGLENVTAKLARLQNLTPVLEKASLKSIQVVQGKVHYPPASGKKMKNLNDAQRRLIFWLLSQGKIPYRRTVQLMRSITSMAGSDPNALSRVEALGKEVHAIIGTNLEYARWVIDEERQAEYHEGTWWTLQGLVRDSSSEIEAVFQRAIDEFIKSV